jgi:farnesol dehydrogenase
MKVLVTGGTGYLGAAIVRALAEHAHEPIVFARRATAAGLPGTAVNGDIRDAAAVRQAVKGVDAVCHAAALVSLWQPDARAFDAVNVGGLETVLAACETHRIARIVYTSSFLALPPAGASEPLQANDYQRTKVLARAAALRAAARGLPIVMLYPGVLYGPGMRTEGDLVGRLIRDHLAGTLPGIVGGSRVWSFAHVDDVARAHVRAIESAAAGEELVLGGENAPQMRVFDVVREITGRRQPRHIPFPLATAAAIVEEARARVTGRPPTITRGAVEIFRRDWPLESTASRGIAYEIRPLKEGLRELLGTLR